MEIKMRINKKITSPQILGIFDVTDESKIRIVVEGAGSGNTFEVKARIQNQTSFVLLKTITGNANETVNVFTYEEVQIECTSFSAVSDEVKIVASSFSDAGGSAIDSIGVPSGDDLTDIETLNLTSSDGSINISGDNATKTIDFTFNDLHKIIRHIFVHNAIIINPNDSIAKIVRKFKLIIPNNTENVKFITNK